jgi:hypothetical protein
MPKEENAKTMPKVENIKDLNELISLIKDT